MTEPGSLATFAGSRARVYRVMGNACARPVDGALMRLLRGWDAQPGPSGGDAPALIESGLKKIRLWLEKSVSSAGAMEALSAEYTRLFRGLRPLDSPPPPYESVYVDGGVLYGTSTDEVRGYYDRFGLGGKDNEPSDHIALELDFMSYLCDREASAWQTEGTAQEWLGVENAFLSEHLAKWVPDLARNIRQLDTTGFYAGLADLLEGWVASDRELVADLLETAAEEDGSPE